MLLRRPEPSARGAADAASSAGMVNTQHQPGPGPGAFTRTRPPWASTMPRQTVRPGLVPPGGQPPSLPSASARMPNRSDGILGSSQAL